jgi:GNAT superfamily N-acetyltransferase
MQPVYPARPRANRLASARVTAETSRTFSDGVVLRWRGPLSEEEMAGLVASYGGTPVPGWWDGIRPHSLGWVTARKADGTVVGFVNVVGDGGDHAFLIDTKTRGSSQRHGIGTRVVEFAAQQAKAAGCEWLHVDFDEPLAAFYFDACGFQPTPAGVIHLPSLPDEPD